MSSPIRAATQSSPISPNSRRRRKSRFTFKQLATLAHYSTSCPLRVIAHVDLDAFYAQCEMVRLGLPETQPLAVQQWQGLIAVNYPARAHGLTRFVNIAEAQKACPDIILQHVATWREGDDMWAYHPDAFKHLATHKVSLDPYRLQSRRILALIRNMLPADLQRVEKASIDEVFVDLSAQVHSVLLQRFPELRGPPPYDDPTERLPAPSISALDWTADALVDLDTSETEDEDPDWDDVAMQIGSEIIRGVRAAIKEQLHYTCSAGVAKNKMLAKLGSANKKPNAQTIIRNRATTHFLSTFKFTKIRNLGGKLGDEIAAAFNTDTVAELLLIPLDALKKRLGDDTGTRLHALIRGNEYSEVNPRTQIKSMLSAKSFRPSINDFETGTRWLRIFVADIHARLVEEGVLENRRRPRTINLSHRQGAQTRSKQAPIPLGRPIDAPLLLDLAKSLLAHVVAEGRAWPCANLSLSVGGFEDGVTGNKGIGGFLVRGDEAKQMQLQTRLDDTAAAPPPPAKRQRLNPDPAGGPLALFLRREGSSTGAAEDYVSFDDVPSAQPQTPISLPSSPSPAAVGGPADATVLSDDSNNADDDDIDNNEKQSDTPVPAHTTPPAPPSPALAPTPPSDPASTSISASSSACPTCGKTIPPAQQAEHADWHFARSLQAEEHKAQAQGVRVAASPSSAAGQRGGRGVSGARGFGVRGGGGGGAAARVEKGQRRLAFGP